MKRDNQGNILCMYAGRIETGESGLIIIRMASNRIRGIAVGAQEPLTMAPALPKDAPEQGAVRSIKLTACPSFCSANAVAAPITPAPIMIVLPVILESTVGLRRTRLSYLAA